MFRQLQPTAKDAEKERSLISSTSNELLLVWQLQLILSLLSIACWPFTLGNTFCVASKIVSMAFHGSWLQCRDNQSMETWLHFFHGFVKIYPSTVGIQIFMLDFAGSSGLSSSSSSSSSCSIVHNHHSCIKSQSLLS